MKAIFNSRTIDASHTVLKVTNRAFCYGDGLFETIVTGPERINLIERHLDRVRSGAEALGMDFPDALSLENIDEWTNELVRENNVTGNYRIRIHLWRDAGGLYTPEKESSSFLLELAENRSPLVLGNLKIGLNEEYMNIYSPISRYKSKNALKYIMLGKIRAERGLDDIILVDYKRHVSESYSSNLFWMTGEQVFTPSLKTGCVGGVMRSYVLDYFATQENPVKEVLTSVEDLKTCESIFTTNGAGIRWFSNYEGRILKSPEALLEPLVRQLQQP